MPSWVQDSSEWLAGNLEKLGGYPAVVESIEPAGEQYRIRIYVKLPTLRCSYQYTVYLADAGHVAFTMEDVSHDAIH